jgi:hypothetical protein
MGNAIGRNPMRFHVAWIMSLGLLCLLFYGVKKKGEKKKDPSAMKPHDFTASIPPSPPSRPSLSGSPLSRSLLSDVITM